MGMQHPDGGRKAARDAGGDLIGRDQAAQHLGKGQSFGLRLGQQGRQDIEPRMAGRDPIAFVQFGPVSGHRVGDGGGVAVGTRAPAPEDRGFGGPGAPQQSFLQAGQFGLAPRGDDGGEIVEQHQRRARPHLRRKILEAEGGGPIADLFQRQRHMMPLGGGGRILVQIQHGGLPWLFNKTKPIFGLWDSLPPGTFDPRRQIPRPGAMTAGKSAGVR